MKRIQPLIGLLLLTCAWSMAQDTTPDRVVVPARNSTRPRIVNVSILNGGITVKTHDGKDVIVEATGNGRSGRRNSDRGAPDGLRRLELPGGSGLEVEEEDNTINVHTRVNMASNITVTVPVNTSLKLRSTNGGEIRVDGVNGEIDANDLNGAIYLNNVSGSVIAHSLNGEVKVSMNRVDAGKPLSFSTMNGSIDVTLPPDIKANVKLKADNGEVYSDFDIKMDLSNRKPLTENDTSGNGRFHVKFDRTVYGSINGGGPEVTFNTFNGRISIRKKK